MTDTKPPLPEPDITSYQTDSIGRKYELRTFSEKRLRAYGDARAAHAVAQMQGEPVAWMSTVMCIGPDYGKVRFGKLPIQSLQEGYYSHTPLYAPATAEQPAETREHILSAHIALSTCDGEGRVDKHHVQIAHEHIEAALGCLAATAPAPEKCEITDAEIDALFPVGLNFEDSDWEKISHDELRSLVRAAIALANGRG